MSKLAPYWKAVAGFFAPAVVVLGYALLATSPGGTSIVGEEWVLALVACFGTSGVVYAAPRNATAPPPKPDEAGAADVALIFYMLGIVFFIVATLNLLGVGTRGLFG